MLTNRKISISSDINNHVAQLVIKYLRDCAASDPEKPVELEINSNGGDVSAAYAIVDVMESIQLPVMTFALGTCASAAVLLLAAGDRGSRVVGANVTVMIHDVRTTVTTPGSVVSKGIRELEDDVKNAQINLRKHKKAVEQNVELLARLTGQPKEKLREDLAQDTYMDAAEAVAYGIADMVRARKDLSKPATAPAAGDAADDDVTIEPPAPAATS